MGKQIRLALSGSGFLAPIHAGAVCALWDSDIEIVEIAGTSGGSIVAAMVASGTFSRDTLHTLALAPFPSGIASVEIGVVLFERDGLNDGDILLEWLRQTIGQTVTLKDTVIPLHIIATDINAGTSIAFSTYQTPDILLADACRASASVPFFYAPYHVDGAKCVDGGMCSNIPVDRLAVDNIPRLGIEVVDGSSAGDTSSIMDFTKQCLNTMLAANESNLVAWAKQTGAVILPVSAKPYGFLDAELPILAKIDLFQRGYDAVQNAVSKL